MKIDFTELNKACEEARSIDDDFHRGWLKAAEEFIPQLRTLVTENTNLRRLVDVQ